MASTSKGYGCSVKPSPLQTLVDNTCGNVSDLIRRYRRKIYRESTQSLQQCKPQLQPQSHMCCNEPAQCNLLNKTQRLFGHWSCENVLLGLFLGLLALLLAVGFFLVRRYNHSFAYGSGGCVSSILYPFKDCPIQA
ncbi:maker689 [Drosophila busckii]|uniref:Maker689 n=1 Tax=Drosophila busckii TaxID=30019 RepID=A0A0M4EYY9_DROBS|nr:uncharacterized protein LOC108599406 [Drosophila busckii]ALC43812.1 maker689 [Drosophila busckii]